MTAFEILDIEQRTEPWYQARAGRVTSTRANAILADASAAAKKRGETEGKQRAELKLDMAVEQLTGIPKDTGHGFRSRSMEDGAELEPEALAYYEAMTGRTLRRTGFVRHLELMAGASLDADVDGFTGIVECKCPDLHTHVGYLRNQTIPLAYRRQMMHQIWLTGAAWGDFISYRRELPEKGRLLVLRLRREEIDLRAYELSLRMFLREVEQEREQLRELLGMAA